MAEREPADAVTGRDDSEAKAPAINTAPLAWHLRATRTVVEYFTVESIWFWTALVPALVLSAVLYTRSVTSNFIFDEQGALLANPYVNGKNLGFWQAVHRDFWGLPPDRSVGSYRPIPDMVW